MNGWHGSVAYAARERMNTLQEEARSARLVRAALADRDGAGLAGWRYRAAGALRRLADAVAPLPEGGVVRNGLETSGGRPLA